MLGLPEDVPSHVTDMRGAGVRLLDWARVVRWLGVCMLAADGIRSAAACGEACLVSVELFCLMFWCCRSCFAPGCLLPEGGC